MKYNYISTRFLGLKFAITPIDYLLKFLVSQVEEENNLKIVFTPNPEQIVYAKSHSTFAKVLGKADILLSDGMGIVIGSQILSTFGKGEPILHRLAGVDVVGSLLQQCQDKRILIIGGREYDNLQFKNWQVVKTDSKSFRLSGKKLNKKRQALYWHEGFLNVTQPTREEQKELQDLIKKIKPEIVFVAFGAPFQEKWIIDNKQELQQSQVRLAMVVGGAFDMLLGKVDRAPKWMRRIGLEWLFRLRQEPWRWRRQLSLLTYIKLIIKEAFN
jgi:N-acetylglucosaminyldiphosphoundecaprenol N-acetyl-beta-D-mannosaminyltransferase